MSLCVCLCKLCTDIITWHWGVIMTYYDCSLIFFLPDSQPRWDLDLRFTPARCLPEEHRGIFKHCWSLFVLRGAVGREPLLFLCKRDKQNQKIGAKISWNEASAIHFAEYCVQSILNSVRTKRVKMSSYAGSHSLVLKNDVRVQIRLLLHLKGELKTTTKRICGCRGDLNLRNHTLCFCSFARCGLV